MFSHAFTFGKFLPFHKGHEAMIQFALTQCQQLTIIVCASDQETISAQQRCHWIEETFDHHPQLHIIPFTYSESDLPNTSKSSLDISRQWAKAFQPYVSSCDAVVTSEPYGNYIAKILEITHIPFDPQRQKVNISATKINQNPYDYWDMLPDPVKIDRAFTVIILGTESTGKTTLTQNLAKHYKATPVYEAGRNLVDNSNHFSFEKLPLIAHTHAQAMLKAKIQSNPLIIVDTDIHITASYAKFCFQRSLNITKDIHYANRANLYLYLDKDAPFVQDGTRMNQQQRDLLDTSHRQTLDEHNIPYTLIQGNWKQRFEQACMQINSALDSYFPWDFRC